jgi:hypothetical protein
MRIWIVIFYWLATSAASISLCAFQCPGGPCRCPDGTLRPPSGDCPKPTPTPPPPPPACRGGELLVSCDVPDCVITLNGQPRGVSSGYEKMRLAVLNGSYLVAAGKPGHKDAAQSVKICNGSKPVFLKLAAKPISPTMVRVRTIPPESDVFVDEERQGRSDSQGLLLFQTKTSAVMIEAHRDGYLSDHWGLHDLRPKEPTREVTLVLTPIHPSLTITTPLASARAYVDQQTEARAVNEPFTLTPGRHQISVRALGYEPITLDITLTPGAKESRAVTLKRLPLAALAQEAERTYRERAYAHVFTLCQYMFEADAAYPPAHHLKGLAHVDEQNYALAESHLARALAGGETILLRVRRHAGEKFELGRGHDVCQARLLLGKSEFEFHGLQVASENFRAPYGQMQMVGLQLRKNTALCLSVKVTLANGKKRDYSFFSYEYEATSRDRAFLEMLQRLLRAH